MPQAVHRATIWAIDYQLIAMSKAYMCRVSDGLADVLDYWAEREGNKPTSLAVSLLEQAIRQAMLDGYAPSFDEVAEAQKAKKK